MLRWILKRVKNDKGFTLIELIVVIAILGVLAGIAVPKLSESRKKAANTAHNANVRTLEGAATMYLADNDLPSGGIEWTKDEGEEDWDLYLQRWPEIPKGVEELKDKNDNDYMETGYKVTIDQSGNIIVEPISIDLDKDDEDD